MIEFNWCLSGRHGEGLSLGGFNQGAGNMAQRQFGQGHEANITYREVLDNQWAFGCLPWLPPERLVVP